MLARALLVLVVCSAARAAEPDLRFKLTLAESAVKTPFTGRVFVTLTRSEPDPLPRSINWFSPEPTFAADVKDWEPGTPLAFEPALAFPTPLADVKPGRYYAQAVIDRDRGGMSFAAADGNVYARPVRVEVAKGEPRTIDLVLDQVYREPAFKETDAVKEIVVESKLLTAFHGRPTRMKAAVVLPPSFAAEPDRKYPVIYSIPGFSGTHTSALAVARGKPGDATGTEMLYVVLDPSCRLGHHVFADSANNGPRGKALVEELIPAIEAKYRGVGTPAGRFVTGGSSGGWSSLWLQVTYPDFFGGCWSLCPDPVDFRDFQRVNLYEPGANLFVTPDGRPRDLSRTVGRQALKFEPFSKMEEVMGHGGQLESFEAVFSPKGADGRPRKLWDRATGAIHTDVAKAWEKYDIRLVLDRNWETLGPKLAGKVHVLMGDEDTFYLDGATRLLKKSLEARKADAVVEMLPGMTHNLGTPAIAARVKREMAEAWKKAGR